MAGIIRRTGNRPQVTQDNKQDGDASGSGDEDRGYFITHKTLVTPDMCDHLGHMNVQHHAKCFGDAAFAIMARLGFGLGAGAGSGAIGRGQRRVALVAGRMEVDYLAELAAGDVITVRSALTDLAAKRVTFLHRMHDAETGCIAARAQVLSVCVDLDQRRSCPIPDDIAEKICALAL